MQEGVQQVLNRWQSMQQGIGFTRIMTFPTSRGKSIPLERFPGDYWTNSCNFDLTLFKQTIFRAVSYVNKQPQDCTNIKNNMSFLVKSKNALNMKV